MKPDKEFIELLIQMVIKYGGDLTEMHSLLKDIVQNEHIEGVHLPDEHELWEAQIDGDADRFAGAGKGST